MSDEISGGEAGAASIPYTTAFLTRSKLRTGWTPALAALRLVSTAVVVSAALSAQVCRLSVAGLNRDRRVLGPVNVECPSPVHSAPFGNWGVTSNFGQKRDAHQFDGWCHDSQVTFNNGQSRLACRSEWYQWNSCTDHPDFRAPNCSIYNAEDCTQQATATGVNVVGTIDVDIPVGCPVDGDADGIADQGGCADVRTYSNGTNFMTLYELDPLTGDNLVQSLFYPSIALPLDCAPASCPQTGSQWMSPVGYDDPPAPPLVFAEFALTVNSGAFDDQGRCAGGLLSLAQPASAANYATDRVARGSILALFGSDLAPREQPAVALPLPTALAGVEVVVFDAAGQSRLARLAFVSPTQVNLVLPDDVSPGPARIEVRRNARAVAGGRIEVVDTAPGVFSADSSGSGPAAAVVTRVGLDGSQSTELTFVCDAAGCRSRPIAARNDRLFVTLFGVGWRFAEASAIRATIGGVSADILYAGPQNVFAGLDQVNFEAPSGLFGELVIEVAVSGRRSNPTTVRIVR